MLRKPRLLTPGPTEVLPSALLAAAGSLPHHRTEEFRAAVRDVLDGLRHLYDDTKHDVLFFACSGTGAMEGAVTNFLSPGDAVVVLRAGKFGERWLELARAYGLRPVDVAFPDGRAIDPGALAKALSETPDARAVFVQASETSTGVVHPVEKLAPLVRDREDCVFVVDAITALGVVPVRPDAWGLDVVIGGSQKALMIPPGLAFASVSPKAWRARDRARLPRYYFDFKRERDSQSKGEAAFTPAISLVLSLRAALAHVRAVGRDALLENADVLAEATRAAAKALGLRLFPEESPSPAVTAIRAPDGMDSGAIVKALKERFALTVSNGQGSLRGKIFRIAHLGYYDFPETVGALAALEIALLRLGVKVEVGSAVRAAEEVYLRRTEAR
jgi:aspartate aminotransferase-like enzyme